LRIQNSNSNLDSSINWEDLELDEKDDTLGISPVRFFSLFIRVLIPQKVPCSIRTQRTSSILTGISSSQQFETNKRKKKARKFKFSKIETVSAYLRKSDQSKRKRVPNETRE